jgi:hypothetical protein
VQLSDAERERLFELLKAHAVAGRLSVEELERRVEIVAASQTSQAAAAALDGLPAQPPAPIPPGPPPRAWGRRGHGEDARPQPGWEPTNERFRDPRSGRIMRVWVDGAGGRHYVPDGG